MWATTTPAMPNSPNAQSTLIASPTNASTAANPPIILTPSTSAAVSPAPLSNGITSSPSPSTSATPTASGKSSRSASLTVTLGPSPYDEYHTTLTNYIITLDEHISRLQDQRKDTEAKISEVVAKKSLWEQQERARLEKEEQERKQREKEEAERKERERLEAERIEAERIEAARLEKERLDRLAREAAEAEAKRRAEAEAEALRLEQERQQKLKEEQRLAKEKADKEEADKKDKERRQREQALAAAASGAIAAQASSSVQESPLMTGGKPLNLRCAALYDLDGDSSNDELSFITGDLFTVTREMNGWYSAKQDRTGKVGLVPANYLTVIDEAPVSNGISGNSTASSTTTASPASSASALMTAVALYDFVGENDDELSFNAGEELCMSGEVNGWFIGTIKGQQKVGIFPSNYVQLQPTSPTSNAKDTHAATTAAATSPAADSAVASITYTPATTADTHTSTTSTTATTPTRASVSNAAVVPTTPPVPTPSADSEPDAVALYDYTATSADQISLKKGAKLSIKAALAGWYVGNEIGSDKVGSFPANYVRRVEKLPEPPATPKHETATDEQKGEQLSWSYNTDSQDKKHIQQEATKTGAAAAAILPASPAVEKLVSPAIMGHVFALYDFRAGAADQMTVTKGTEIMIVKQINEWYEGWPVNKQKEGTKFIPCTYCTALQPLPPEATTTQPAATPITVGVAQPQLQNTAAARTSGGQPNYPVVTIHPPPVTAKPKALTQHVQAIQSSTPSSSEPPANWHQDNTTATHSITSPMKPAAAGAAAATAAAAAATAAGAVTLPERHPTDRLAIALYDWETKEKGELSFKKNDRLIIQKESRDGWYTGYIEGTARVALFPSTLVTLVSGTDALLPANTAASIATTAQNTPTTSTPTTPQTDYRQLSMGGGAPASSLPAPMNNGGFVPSNEAMNIIAQLEKGMLVNKLDSKGKASKPVRLYLEREKLGKGKEGDFQLRWDTKKLFNPKLATMKLQTAHVKRGLNKPAPADPHAATCGFTVINEMRPLEIICQSENDRETWIAALVGLGVQLTVPLEELEQSNAEAPPAHLPTSPQQQVHVTDGIQLPPQTQQQPQAALLPASPANPGQGVSLGMMKPSIRPTLATALYDFGSEPDDLRFMAGDEIELVTCDPTAEWWTGRNKSEGQTSKDEPKMFPANYVQVKPVTEQPMPAVQQKQPLVQQPQQQHQQPALLQPQAGLAKQSSSSSNQPGLAKQASINAVPVSLASPTPAPSSLLSPSLGRVKAMYDFDTDITQNPTDLPFKEGDVITLLIADPREDWWTGMDAKGRKGIFPKTFVQKV